MCYFHFFRRMNDFSLSCQLKVQASKRRITKVDVVIFVPFFSYFLICLQVWLRRRSGEVPLRCALSFFTWDWSQSALRSVLTHSSCFVSWKFLILLTQTEIAVLCSPSNSWKRSPSRPAFCFFFFFFHLPDPEEEEGQRNPLNPWMDFHERHVNLRQRRRDGGMFLGEAVDTEWNNEKQNIRADKIQTLRYWVVWKREEKRKVIEVGCTEGVGRFFSPAGSEVLSLFCLWPTLTQTTQSLSSTEGPVKLPLWQIKTPHLWTTVSLCSQQQHHLLI